ncbi:MAG: VIT1/CCC1 transporter family protein [Proteobacteria bacterium]|nr:VIT1/CCC1 transporter family protein [Pseudomonadota bacterium]
MLVEGGNLRATVMGGTDGLITSLAFVFGVAGLAGSTQLAILAGVISAVGGALSMAAGEWLSVTSQNEKYRSTLHTLDRLLRDDPRAAEATLLEAAATRGFSPAHAKDLARAVLQEPDRLEAAAVDLGLIPRKLDCPTGAALSSFASFLLGATIPLVPLVIGANGLSLTLSAAVSAVALAAGGAWLASNSGKSPLLGALRMLGLGGVAAAATYGTGVLAAKIFPWP